MYRCARNKSASLWVGIEMEVAFSPAYWCSSQPEDQAIDRYGRTVAELFRNGQNINQRMVREGQAFVYWQYIGGCDRQTYGAL